MSSTATHNVFVYGSLLADEVVSILLKRIPASSAAILPDFFDIFSHRYSLKGSSYPAILPLKGDKVTGKVFFGITDKELTVLDDFEDIEYQRQVVEPLLMSGCQSLASTSGEVPYKMLCYAYVWADADDEHLFGDWDYEEWRKLHLEDFTSTCRNYASENII